MRWQETMPREAWGVARVEVQQCGLYKDGMGVVSGGMGRLVCQKKCGREKRRGRPDIRHTEVAPREGEGTGKGEGERDGWRREDRVCNEGSGSSLSATDDHDYTGGT